MRINDHKLRDIPVLIFSGRDLTPDESAQLRLLSSTVVPKGLTNREQFLSRVQEMLK